MWNDPRQQRYLALQAQLKPCSVTAADRGLRRGPAHLELDAHKMVFAAEAALKYVDLDHKFWGDCPIFACRAEHVPYLRKLKAPDFHLQEAHLQLDFPDCIYADEHSDERWDILYDPIDGHARLQLAETLLVRYLGSIDSQVEAPIIDFSYVRDLFVAPSDDDDDDDDNEKKNKHNNDDNDDDDDDEYATEQVVENKARDEDQTQNAEPDDDLQTDEMVDVSTCLFIPTAIWEALTTSES